ncbi:energy-coupling factor transporter transmembrane protein EcfT [Alkalibacterium sp. 20]|uniref:energy-coupling factor transporter transmembrane component T family protein n=1 Tax=Alkalibacterium sp. 20 TaxID=1798803 RepID=UPI0009000D72|nr:energy-coupling factor transporter transmembrane component T [Alkalibacterium sp. 20]OJF92909.1 cobalt ABC transporter permease [Alkalibacterium sp. 20]
MNTMTLYVERNSPIHRLDPLVKLLYVAASILLTYILPEPLYIGGILFVTFLLLIIGKVFRNSLPIVTLSMFLIFSLVIVQGFFHPDNVTELFAIGPLVFYEEGLYVALVLVMRVLVMVGAFSLLILTTATDEMVERLIKKGMSPKIGHVILSVLQLIPQMRATMVKITDAQRSRGVETEGDLLTRVKAFFPLIGPVVLNSLNETKERSIALEMRGFDSPMKKTFLNEAKQYPHNKLIAGLITGIVILGIVWRVFG